MSQIIDIWMRNHSIVSDNNYNIVDHNAQKHLQGVKNNVRFTLSDYYTGGLQLALSKTNSIGDTKHNI